MNPHDPTDSDPAAEVPQAADGGLAMRRDKLEIEGGRALYLYSFRKEVAARTGEVEDCPEPGP